MESTTENSRERDRHDHNASKSPPHLGSGAVEEISYARGATIVAQIRGSLRRICYIYGLEKEATIGKVQRALMPYQRGTEMSQAHHPCWKPSQLLLVVAAVATLGCAQQGHEAPAAEPIALDERAAPADLPSELWDVSYIGGKKVGYMRTTFKRAGEGDRAVVDIDQQGVLSVSRFGTPVTINMTFQSRESAAGALQNFKSTLKLGPLPNVSEGVVKDRSLETTTTSLGKKATKTLAWDPDWGGFFAVDQSLRTQPLKPGEERSFKALMPLATDVAVADVKLKADDFEMTELLEGQRELLKISVTMKTGGPHDTEQTIWANRRGEVLKSFTDDLGGMTTYRTSREIALRKSDAGSFDLGKFSTVPVGAIRNPHDTKRIAYRITLKSSDPREVFSTCGSQRVTAIDEHSANVTVIAIGPTSPAKLSIEPTPPADEDLASNNLIQSDDRRIAELAADTLPNETDPWKLALALENAVYRKMTAKNFSTAFATAAEVARSLEGDCTEHAVLLAALCRARKIPARVAIGLVYYAPQRGFAFHMWNEVWAGDRWVPLDATLGRGGIGAAHLKLTDSSLAGADSFSAFMPVAKVMGQLEIEVVDPRP